MPNLATHLSVHYERWKGQLTRFGSKARTQNRLLPDDVFTCWVVNTTGVQASWSLNVATCGACVLFYGDKKDLLSHLRGLGSNKDLILVPM
jgi:hypothetical protein